MIISNWVDKDMNLRMSVISNPQQEIAPSLWVDSLSAGT